VVMYLTMLIRKKDRSIYSTCICRMNILWQTSEPVQSCTSRQTRCRASKGFDRFLAVVDLHGYVNAATAAAA